MVIDYSRPTAQNPLHGRTPKIVPESVSNESSVSEEKKVRLSVKYIELRARRWHNYSDFGYGCVTDAVLSTVLDVSKKYNLLLFGDVQCSSQIGNVLKFENFDMICPTEREARVSLANKDDNVEAIATRFYLQLIAAIF